MVTRRGFLLLSLLSIPYVFLPGCVSVRRGPIERLPNPEVKEGIFKPSKIKKPGYGVNYEIDLMLEDRLHMIEYMTTNPNPANIILVPSLGEHAGSLNKFSRTLAKYGYNVFAIDVEGHGKTKGERGKFNVEGVHQNLETTINHVSSNYENEVSFIGTSIGADFILSYLLCNESSKNKVNKAVLHAPLAPWERDIARKLEWGIDCLQSKICKFIAKGFLEESLSLNFLFDFGRLYSDEGNLVSILEDELYLKSIDKESYINFLRYKPRHPYKDLNVPLLIVASEKDNIIPLRYLKELFNRIRNQHDDTYFYVLKDASHLAFDEYYNELAPVFSEWIEAIR